MRSTDTEEMAPGVAPALPAGGTGTRGPLAQERPYVHERHGDIRPDPYAWLRDREHPAVIAHLEAENRHVEAALAHTRGLRESLYAEMAARMGPEATDCLHPWGAYLYYTRVEPGRAYPLHCRVPAGGGDEQVVLDLDRCAGPGGYLALRAFVASPDHSRLAYAVDTSGEERFTVRVRDLDTGLDLPEQIEGTCGEVVWGADGRTLYYTVADTANRPYRVKRRALGRPDEDVVLLEELDPAFFAHLSAGRSGRFVFLTLRGRVTSECRVLDTRTPDEGFRTVVPRSPGIQYEVVDSGDRFFLRTNDGAPDFQVVAAPVEAPGRESWIEVVPPRAGVQVVSVEAFARHLVVHERENGTPRVRVLDASGEGRPVPLPAWAVSVRPGVNRDHGADVYRLVCSSPVHPPQVLEVPLGGGVPRVVHQAPVGGGHSPADYRVRRLCARAPDGTPVPITLVDRPDRQSEGEGGPTLLTGYGAYGFVEDLGFRPAWLSLLDRGIVLAVAHVRGGGHLGRGWYEQGRLRRKENTFSDFIACAEHLLEEGIARRGALAVQGASAGGLLVATVLNRRPDLFRAGIAEVPFVDVLTTSFDESLPGTVAEWEEWGDPNDPALYEYMRAYSPYDNVSGGDYPHLLVTTSLNDRRVGYWEAAKWVARLRAVKKNDTLLLLKIEMNAGHHGRSGRYDRLEDMALQYAFLLDALGVDATGPEAGAPHTHAVPGRSFA